MASKGKLVKYNVMMGDDSLRKYLPRTKRLKYDSFSAMLDKYGSVIVKPTYGSGGVGVIKVSASKGDKYTVHTGTRKKVLSGKEEAYVYVKRKTSSRSHIVQRYIPLAKVNGRPIDLRVMVQRKAGGPWTVTGKLAKVAGAHHIITNVARSNGYVLPAGTALRKAFSKSKASSILKKLDKVALKTAEQLTYRFRHYHITGLDMGVDRKGKVWIIESNSAPALSLFLKLKNKKPYKRIMRFKR